MSLPSYGLRSDAEPGIICHVNIIIVSFPQVVPLVPISEQRIPVSLTGFSSTKLKGAAAGLLTFANSQAYRTRCNSACTQRSTAVSLPASLRWLAHDLQGDSHTEMGHQSLLRLFELASDLESSQDETSLYYI